MNNRKLWFITRPERDPQFHAEALKALQQATNNFTAKWNGNRVIQKNYEQALVDAGLKRDNISDSGSGGRTWCAMLRTFAYCYIDDAGFLHPTRVGEALLKGEKEHDNVSKQILTLQIPNAYFLEKGFRPKYEEDFAIRPARFLIKLVNQESLDYYLTKEEITYFALTAKRDSDLDSVTENILNFRSANDHEKEDMKAAIAAEYDHRERSDRGARDYYKAHSDVAHTFMMISDYTGLVDYVRRQYLRVRTGESEQLAQVLKEFDERYPYNTRYKFSLLRMAQNNGLDVSSYKANHYGSARPATNRDKTERKISETLSQIPDISSVSQATLKGLLSQIMNEAKAASAAAKIKSDFTYSSLNLDFVEKYLGEMTALEFEDQTASLLEAIGFEVILRPKAQGTSSEIEILIKYGENKCGIIDTKYYGNGFPLSANLATYMGAEYLPSYNGFEGCEVEFFAYITSTDFSGVKNLEKITKLTETTLRRSIQGALINRKTLLAFLDYCVENDIPQDQRIQMFLAAMNNTGYDNLELFLKNFNPGEQNEM